MILTCPECATRYQTDASHFSPDGRKVRCAKCGHMWFQPAVQADAETVVVHDEPAPQHEETVIPPQVEPKREARDVRAEAVATKARPRPDQRLALGAGWAALALIVVGAGWTAMHYRQDIANLWPQSASLYAALGSPVNTRGLEFRDRSAHFESQGGQVVLVVTGNLANITSHELSVPAIHAALMDDDRRELYHWSFSTGIATLRPGQLAVFRTRIPSPPSATRDVELRFAERSN